MIEGNTESDGTGEDISKNLYIKNFYAFAKDVKFVVDNQSGKDGYITSISIRGDIARVTQAIQVEVQDDESVLTYGDQILQIENDYILNETYAQNLANDKLFNLKDPLTKVHMETVGIPYLQLGDIVTVPENFGLNTQNLFIKKKRWQLLEDGDYVEYLDLQSKTLASWFLLDQSILDGTDVLSE